MKENQCREDLLTINRCLMRLWRGWNFKDSALTIKSGKFAADWGREQERIHARLHSPAHLKGGHER